MPASYPPIARCAAIPEVYWPKTEVERRMRALAARYPEMAHLETFGHTSANRPLTGLRVGNRDCCVALLGALHACESGPELIVPVLARLLERDRVMLDKVGVAALPSVNGEARERLRQRLARGERPNFRGNLNGVDLNRNFPTDWDLADENYGVRSDDPASVTFRGQSPGSEPETRAVMAFVRRTQPAALFSFHFINSIAGACFHGAHCARDDAAYVGRCLELVPPYTAAFYDDPAGRAAKRLHVNYPDFGGSLYYMFSGGTLCTWVYRTFGIPAFDLEEGSDLPAERAARSGTVEPKHLDDCRQRHYRGLRAALEQLAAEPAVNALKSRDREKKREAT